MSTELEALRQLHMAGAYVSESLRNKITPSKATELKNVLYHAIKRNEPMKPLIKDMGFEHYNFYCPSCKEYIGFKNSVRESSILKYCPDCGQRIEEEEANE